MRQNSTQIGSRLLGGILIFDCHILIKPTIHIDRSEYYFCVEKWKMASHKSAMGRRKCMCSVICRFGLSSCRHGKKEWEMAKEYGAIRRIRPITRTEGCDCWVTECSSWVLNGVTHAELTGCQCRSQLNMYKKLKEDAETHLILFSSHCSSIRWLFLDLLLHIPLLLLRLCLFQMENQWKTWENMQLTLKERKIREHVIHAE